jgi:hypothetical protein
MLTPLTEIARVARLHLKSLQTCTKYEAEDAEVKIITIKVRIVR